MDNIANHFEKDDSKSCRIMGFNYFFTIYNYCKGGM